MATPLFSPELSEQPTVHAFDLQTAAIEATRRLLRTKDLMTRVTLHHLGHEKMEEVLPIDLPGRVSVVTFNLGYLPGGDQSLVTDPVSTLPALQSALRFLRPGVHCIAYPGHPADGRSAKPSAAKWQPDGFLRNKVWRRGR